MELKPAPAESQDKARQGLYQLFSKLAMLKGYTNSLDYATFMSVAGKYLDKYIAGVVKQE